MKQLRAMSIAAVIAAATAACTDEADTPLEPASSASVTAAGAAQVTTNADAGPGSFRRAVDRANENPAIGQIRFHAGLGTIALRRPIVFSGSQALTIDATGASLDGNGLAGTDAALVAEGGGDLTIRRLVVHRAPGNGITVAVPADAGGTIRVQLEEVTIRGNALHGVLINDQAEYLSDPASESDAGSNASIAVRVTGSTFELNGLGALDYDGLRVNEGGRGDINAIVSSSRFVGNGADGLELDERAVGDAVFTLSQVDLNRNGSFSTEDLDDGIDVDEAGDGSVIGRFERVSANSNSEQGVDLNENGAGELRVVMHQVEALGNAEEGIEFEEDDDVAGGGDLEAELDHVTTRRNGGIGGDAGLKLREKGPGNLTARLLNVVSTNNAIAGILVQEDENGKLAAELVGVETLSNGGDGIKLDENGAGNLMGRIRTATSRRNANAGVALEQEPSGTGEVRIQSLAGGGNLEGDVAADAGVSVIR
ncbi:MAG: hypothetical protein H0T68_14675 [Gemmatimonadales bacterium]|nr:hypothetical protein [Gemmatimonadales bacterium]